MIKKQVFYSDVVHFWLAIVIVATTFTKLRYYGAISPQEILFVVTIMLLLRIKQNKLFLFYSLSFLTFSFFTLQLNLLLNNTIADGFIHDLLAMVLSLLFLSIILNNKVSISKLLKALYIFITIYLSSIFILGVVIRISYMWYGNFFRLAGLSINPNQITFLVLLLGGLSLYYFLKANSNTSKTLYLFNFLFSVVLSKYVDSDALYLAFISFGLMYVFFIFTKTSKNICHIVSNFRNSSLIY